MRTLIAALATSLSLSLTALNAQAAPKTPDALFYMIDTPKSEASFEAHIDKIGTLVPTWYAVDKNGLVSGGPNPRALRLAKAAGLRVMPIIGLSDRPALHAFLNNDAAHGVFIESLIRQAKLNGYVGFQFDFENLSWLDRDALTKVTRETAAAMHKEGLLLTIAVVPNAPGYPGQGAFSKWIWEYWRGAYDLKALGEAADLISLMTYDQHTRWTTPGPVDGFVWTKQQLDYALQFVPKEKLSLGIALYGYHWFAGNPVKADATEAYNIAGEFIDADASFPLIKQYDVNVQWDPIDKENFFFFYRDQMREWVFMPDARSLAARYELMKADGLEGFSSWVLGSEDPKIWDVLPKARP
jgi:spore germination protein YaaH